MAEEPQQGRGWWFVEMYALGAILHGYDVMTNAGFQASLGWWIAGGIVALAGWHWGRIKPLLGFNEEKARRVTDDLRWWVVSILILFVLPLIPRLVESYFIIYSRLNDPPSHILDLTDAKRWRFVKDFQDLPLPSNGALKISSCSAAVSIKPNSRSANELWDEVRPLLSVPPWRQFGGGPGTEVYRNGITILVPHQEMAAACGARLNEWINSQTPTKALIMSNQATPILEQCKNECVEIHIGTHCKHVKACGSRQRWWQASRPSYGH
jgi:hypothetical protein